jgi:ATP-dependent helicase HrpB
VSSARAPSELTQHPLAVALREAFGSHRDALLSAPTGAGKSTLVPLALLDEPWVAGRKLLMLEPRRLATRAVSARMAALLGERLGATVGYRMRLETQVSRATRIEVVTEGVLTRLLHADPALEGVACVIFDEYHERSLQADLALALALHARRELDAAFRVLVMSATLELESIAPLLTDPALVRVPGRAFAVEVRYLGRGAPLLEAEHAVALAVRRALEECVGDVLAFLPGEAEIHRVEGELGRIPGVQVLALYGQMGSSAQDAVLAPALPGQRKVVLATNVAETSLTIPGVVAVVDSGLVRRPRFDPSTGMSRLELTRISRAASEQRAGRAGRTAPGVCYRLWSASAQERLAEATAPEMLAADLAPLALELARWSIADAASLPWLDPPPPAALGQARALLERLEALDSGGRLTPLGAEMARLAVHPRLAHMLLAARELGAVPLAARLAALLSERDLLAADGALRDPDLRTRLEVLRAGSPRRVERTLTERVQRIAQSLEAALASLPAAASGAAAVPIDEDVMAGALLALAYPDRIGLRRAGPASRGDAAARYLLANGRGAALRAPVSLARAELIVAVALEDSDREARIDLAVPLERPWLERLLGAHIVTEQRIGWDERAAAVSARRIRRLDAIILADEPLAHPSADQTLAAMIEGVRRLGISALPWEPATRDLQARLEFVRMLDRPELAGWPASDEATLAATLETWLAPYLAGITRRAQLERVPLAVALHSRLNPAQQRALETLAPQALKLPSGAQLRIDYRDDSAPCVAARLQEVFGLEATPRVAGGTVPITFKLLSPARRPVQITRDLAGFWRSSYREVRKDLRGRYPKHDWPEDPLQALPRLRSRPRS